MCIGHLHDDVEINDELVLDENESDEDHEGNDNATPLYVLMLPHFSYINWEALDALKHSHFGYDN